MDTDASAIDPQRPWIRDPRDDPKTMNWAATLFNPFGETGKLHFSRAWTLMFMGRLLLYLVPSVIAGIIGVAGIKTDVLSTPVSLVLFTVPALLLPFAVFTIATEFTSFVAHLRRLAEARRPTWLAVIVLVPMMCGLAAYMAGTGMGAAQYRAMNAPPEAAGETSKAGERAETSGSAQRAQRGRGGPPPSEREMAMSTGLGLGLGVWALLSFIVMSWTLLWVARLPNGGEGRLRSGSHLSPEEIASGA